MSNFSHLSLQKAVYQHLSGDTALMALVEGVYDRPPQGSAYPYITLGDIAVADWSTKTTEGFETLLTLQVWSRGGGRKEAALVAERVYALLHRANLSVSGHALVFLRFAAGDIELLDDGVTYHGRLRFRALLQALA
jgi:hypothetical protein